MIAFLKGRVISKNNTAAVVLVQDVGYQVFCGENFLNTLKINEEQEFYIYHHVKEDASDLYGFQTSLDLEIFSLLLSVSGVGPKSALGVLSVSSAQDVSQAIMQGDPNLLTKVSGIGKKTAERIVLELKTKIGKLGANSDSNLTLDGASYGSDEIDALMSLGYSLSEARQALSSLPSDLSGSGERVKAALKKMKKI
jgi:Holliday junction DNA helicase RuvA